MRDFVWLLAAVWALGFLPLLFAGHAAITGYWGSEWENATTDFAAWLVLWAIGWLGIYALLKATRPGPPPERDPQERR